MVVIDHEVVADDHIATGLDGKAGSDKCEDTASIIVDIVALN